MKNFFSKFIARLEKSVDRRYYIPLIGLLAFLDLFIVVFPVDWIIISTTLLRKDKGYRLAFACAVGSALGALLLGILSHLYGLSVIEYFSEGITHTKRWEHTSHQVHLYGAWALAFISLGPLPQHPAVVLCGLAKIRAYKIFGAVFFARLAKYFFFVWAATNAPQVLRKLGIKKSPPPTTPTDTPGVAR